MDQEAALRDSVHAARSALVHFVHVATKVVEDLDVQLEACSWTLDHSSIEESPATTSWPAIAAPADRLPMSPPDSQSACHGNSLDPE